MSFAKGIKFNEYRQELLHLLLPARCGACSVPLAGSERALCTSCLRRLPRTRSHLYPCRLLEEKIYGRIPLSPARSFLVFNRTGMTRELLHHVKYEGRPDLARALGQLYAYEMKQQGIQLAADALLPVPLHWRRQWQRGYNQSEAFAAGIAEVFDIPVKSRWLRRTGRRNSQTRKTRFERWGRMEGEFEYSGKQPLEGLQLLLVDDVVTTGSTLEACARELCRHGSPVPGFITLAVVK